MGMSMDGFDTYSFSNDDTLPFAVNFFMVFKKPAQKQIKIELDHILDNGAVETMVRELYDLCKESGVNFTIKREFGVKDISDPIYDMPPHMVSNGIETITITKEVE